MDDKKLNSIFNKYNSVIDLYLVVSTGKLSNYVLIFLNTL